MPIDPLTILPGDCRETLASLPAESVQCCVTSPPYFGLRDYGTGTWDGGDTSCDHAAPPGGGPTGATLVGTGNRGKYSADGQYKDVCWKCGAVRQDKQIGLEQTPEAFVAEMVGVFREVRRVLREDGVLWLNLGDSYTGSGKGGNPEAGKQATNRGSQSVGSLYGTGKSARDAAVTNVTRRNFDLGPKQLLGIPWRVAFALQADGWILRQDIIWSKPNPMPESVTDRCTKAHEYLFLLSKTSRYFFDSRAIAEPSTGQSPGNVNPQKGEIALANGDEKFRTRAGLTAYASSQRVQRARAEQMARDAGLTQAHLDAIRAVGITDAGKSQVTQTGYGKNDPAVQALADHAKSVLGGYYREFTFADTRNKRSVWTVATKPYSEAHFATFPPDLIRPCILAGTRPGDTVLDPFGGSGTTGMVALQEGRSAILCELNPSYCDLIRQRCHITPGFAFGSEEETA